MSWDRKPNGKSYYYRNKRVDGRSVKDYVGRGSRGDKAAQLDEQERLQRQLDRQHWFATLTRLDNAEQSLDQLVYAATTLMRTVLIVSGFYLHKGHEWRNRKSND